MEGKDPESPVQGEEIVIGPGPLCQVDSFFLLIFDVEVGKDEIDGKKKKKTEKGRPEKRENVLDSGQNPPLGFLRPPLVPEDWDEMRVNF